MHHPEKTTSDQPVYALALKHTRKRISCSDRSIVHDCPLLEELNRPEEGQKCYYWVREKNFNQGSASEYCAAGGRAIRVSCLG